MASAEQVSRRLKLRHLHVLRAVVEHGSMMKAAEQLAVSQPVVSKAIADLEQTLGVRLLERGKRGVEPTIYGSAFLKRSIAVFDDLRTSVSELEFMADPTAGELRIGSTEAMGTSLVPVIIDRMSRQYPRIRFEVVLADPDTLQERELRGRKVDLVIGQRILPGFRAQRPECRRALYRSSACRGRQHQSLGSAPPDCAQGPYRRALVSAPARSSGRSARLRRLPAQQGPGSAECRRGAVGAVYVWPDQQGTAPRGAGPGVYRRLRPAARCREGAAGEVADTGVADQHRHAEEPRPQSRDEAVCRLRAGGCRIVSENSLTLRGHARCR